MEQKPSTQPMPSLLMAETQPPEGPPLPGVTEHGVPNPVSLPETTTPTADDDSVEKSNVVAISEHADYKEPMPSPPSLPLGVDGIIFYHDLPDRVTKAPKWEHDKPTPPTPREQFLGRMNREIMGEEIILNDGSRVIGENLVLNNESISRLSAWMDMIVPTPSELDAWNQYVKSAIRVSEDPDGSERYRTADGEPLNPDIAKGLIDKTNFEHWIIPEDSSEFEDLTAIVTAERLYDEAPEDLKSEPSTLSRLLTARLRTELSPFIPQLNLKDEEITEHRLGYRSGATRLAEAKTAADARLSLSRHSAEKVYDINPLVFDQALKEERERSREEFYSHAFRAQDLSVSRLRRALQDETAANALLGDALQQIKWKDGEELEEAETEIARLHRRIEAAQERAAYFSSTASPNLFDFSARLEREAIYRATQRAREASIEYQRYLKEGNPENPEFFKEYLERYYPSPAELVVTLDDLVEQWADEEAHDDKTSALGVQDEIEDILMHDPNLNDNQKLDMIEELFNRKESILASEYDSKDEATVTAEPQSPQRSKFDRLVRVRNLLRKPGSKSVERERILTGLATGILALREEKSP